MAASCQSLGTADKTWCRGETPGPSSEWNSCCPAGMGGCRARLWAMGSAQQKGAPLQPSHSTQLCWDWPQPSLGCSLRTQINLLGWELAGPGVPRQWLGWAEITLTVLAGVLTSGWPDVCLLCDKVWGQDTQGHRLLPCQLAVSPLKDQRGVWDVTLTTFNRKKKIVSEDENLFLMWNILFKIFFPLAGITSDLWMKMRSFMVLLFNVLKFWHDRLYYHYRK